MEQYSTSSSRPLALSASTQSQVYGLFTVAMALTFVGVFLAMTFIQSLMSSGVYLVLTIAELAIIFTSRWWSKTSPMNYVLFGLFPLLSGITITPYILMIASGYANGGQILLNAVGATVCMSLAAVVLSRIAPNLAVWGKALMFAVIGLLILSLLQIFVPALQTQGAELFISGIGVVIFGFFTAFDLQRIEAQGRLGANPFMLALSLYLDIYNLFLYILRFMTALSGNRR
jgi:FtsH-binding integral membrane protein